MSKASKFLQHSSSINESKRKSISESGKDGWCLYYNKDTDVNGEMFKKGQVIEGPFSKWEKSDAQETLDQYDDNSSKNLKIGYKTVKNGFIES